MIPIVLKTTFALKKNKIREQGGCWFTHFLAHWFVLDLQYIHGGGAANYCVRACSGQIQGRGRVSTVDPGAYYWYRVSKKSFFYKTNKITNGRAKKDDEQKYNKKYKVDIVNTGYVLHFSFSIKHGLLRCCWGMSVSNLFPKRPIRTNKMRPSYLEHGTTSSGYHMQILFCFTKQRSIY